MNWPLGETEKRPLPVALIPTRADPPTLPNPWVGEDEAEGVEGERAGDLSEGPVRQERIEGGALGAAMRTSPPYAPKLLGARAGDVSEIVP